MSDDPLSVCCRHLANSQHIIEAKDDEIARLRGDAEVARLRLEAAHADIARLRLTDAEREAIERGYCSLMGVEDMSAESTRWDTEAAATLSGLLERLGGEQ